ncbi:MAG: hypothetical protein IH949_13605 [Bacteroidetes bacterium]|nr:hypothetical protein [Bacteroidota bacterium]
MPICTKRKLAFCHIPRTGGQSIIVGLDLIINDYHYPASYYREKYPDYFLFATYRPYKYRLKSAKKYYVTNQSNDIKLKNRKKLIIRKNDYFLDCRVDYLIQFIDLENDLNKMLKILNLSPIKLPHLYYCRPLG